MSNIISFDEYLFHPSSLFKLFTEPKTKADKKAGLLSVTTVGELRKIYRQVKFKRREEFESKHTKKGKLKEEEVITLVSRVKKQYYIKNTVRLTNEYLTGEPDACDTNDVLTCTKGLDVKAAWSLWTLPYKDDEIKPMYYWQNLGYMCLCPNATEWVTAHGLVNAIGDQILNEKKSIWYKLGMPSEESDDNYEEYIEKCINIEENMIFNMSEFKHEERGFALDHTNWDHDMELKDRVVDFLVLRDEEAIEKIKTTVIKCRAYLNSLNYII